MGSQGLAALILAQKVRPGTRIIHGQVDAMELGLTFDYSKFRLDAWQVRSIAMVLNVIPTDVAELAMEAIRAVGPGGESMTHRHTFDHLRSRSQAQLLDRRSRTPWEQSDQPDIIERAYQAAAARIKEHRPHPVGAGVTAEVDAIVEDYLARCRKDG